MLIPFSILVAIGLHYTAASTTPPSPGAYVVNTPPILDFPDASAVPLAAAPVIDAGAAVEPEPEPEPEPDAGAPEATPRELEAALTALRPAVRQCFDDARTHAPSRVELRVRFTAKSDGHFTGYRLESRTWQDPYLEACMEDVFDEVTYTPSGREPADAVTHTFVLGGR